MSDAPTHALSRVLVANRGEIAIRVFRTLRDMNIESVAIYSDADHDALHVRHADRALCIGGTLPGESYLDIGKVLEAARAAGADAVHPGYGFLAENADFARAVANAGMTWIGPPPDAIDQMGSKTTSRAIMQDAGVPVIPGTTTPVESYVDLERAVAEIGYPVAVKAAYGGGGKGFRVALSAAELESAYEGASREGERFFGNGSVYVERYLADPRHVEVQIFADTHGNIVHLGERDCTIQRRHQKLVEEAPGPTVSVELRERLGQIGIEAARAVGYVGAGTIECLLDTDGTAYFLEMNTRIQVEHTVTEAVTGFDLVAEQVRVAQGHPLSMTQADVVMRGHAIEVRINAENAWAHFAPSSGRITRWRIPEGPGVRVDAGVREGGEASQYYDNLLAKLIVWGSDREHARRRMLRALHEFDVRGVATLIEFHARLLASEAFIRATSAREIVENPELLGESPQYEVAASEHQRSPVPTTRIVEVEGERFVVRIRDNDSLAATPPPVRARGTATADAHGTVHAPIPGTVLSVGVTEQAHVNAGDVVCILEAMKMENEIAAPVSGTVTRIAVAEGANVQAGDVLVDIEPALT